MSPQNLPGPPVTIAGVGQPGAPSQRLLLRPRWLACCVLALTAGAVWLGRGSAFSAAVPEHGRPPSEMGLWVGSQLSVDRRESELLKADQVSFMEYHLGNEPPVWLARVSGLGKRAAFHPPELCFVGSRFEVLERGPLTVLVKGLARRLTRLVIGLPVPSRTGRQTGRDGQRIEVWYWFTAGGRMSPSYYQQQAWLLADAIRGQRTSGTLVRISTPLTDPAGARRRLLAFVTAWEMAEASHPSHGS